VDNQTLCPFCNLSRSPTPGCATYHNGVCHRLPEDLREHMATIYAYREAQDAYQPIADYNALPQALAQTDFMWRIRAEDVEIVQRHLPTTPAEVLEIGAYNGWLSQHIARGGHHLTAVGYSDHPTHGLSAKQHYTVDWHAISMDVADLTQFQRPFDYVIVNHGLHLFPDPVATIAQAKALLKPGGVLIALGIIVHRNPHKRAAQVQQDDTAMRAATGLSYYLRPTQGYISNERQLKLTFAPYRCMWRANLKALLRRTAPCYLYGVFTQLP